MSTIGALILSLPERAHLLTEALASVHAQTRPPDDVVIGEDPYRLGQVRNGNRLAAATDCDWVAWLDSDDTWHPEHLATCEALFDDADVVVSRFDLVGRPWSSIEPWHPHAFEDLRRTQWIGSASMVVVRKSAFTGWRDPTSRFRWVDWSSYNAWLDEGARFVDTGVVTTTYRFGAWSNGSWKAG